MVNHFHSEILKKHPALPARIMKITSPHGEVITPTFMPVGTKAVVNFMLTDDLTNCASQIILGGNTYHMLCSPGLEIIQKMGGMHRFMAWPKPMLTDSGGYQVLSLSKNKKICTINETGAHFKHPQTGRVIHLTPQSSIETQKIIGADIIMAFDECTLDAANYDAALNSMQRTHRWLLESKTTHDHHPNSAYGYRQALFGIIQGGTFRELREQSAQFVVQSQVDGIAIGGETVGFDMKKTIEVIDWVRPILPEQKIRYTMGVGLNPQDLIDVVAKGIDIFDCVAPTRNARHGALYHGHAVAHQDWVIFDVCGEEKGRILIKKSQYAKDERPILADCHCFTCRHYSRAYLHFLFKSNAVAYSNLACIHNIHVMQAVCLKMQAAIDMCTMQTVSLRRARICKTPLNQD
jgi:queuine tRNA-ribosyltransferase